MKIRKIEIGQRTLAVQEKVILLVGNTGAGKSTLLNGMMNYVMGVEWSDNFRLKLVGKLKKNPDRDQDKSQTKWITAYTIHHQQWFTIPYTLTIIDTPGFGDTEGIERDKCITEQIRQFLSTEGPNGIDHLDAVGFVVQSSQVRLSPAQKYIFHSVLSLFGQDIAGNILLLFTFADQDDPKALAAVRADRIPSVGYFKFNNSVLYSNPKIRGNDNATYINPFIWEECMKNFPGSSAKIGKYRSTVASTDERSCPRKTTLGTSFRKYAT